LAKWGKTEFAKMSVWFESQDNYNQQLFSSVYAGQFVLIDQRASTFSENSEINQYIEWALDLSGAKNHGLVS